MLVYEYNELFTDAERHFRLKHDSVPSVSQFATPKVFATPFYVLNESGNAVDYSGIVEASAAAARSFTGYAFRFIQTYGYVAAVHIMSSSFSKSYGYLVCTSCLSSSTAYSLTRVQAITGADRVNLYDTPVFYIAGAERGSGAAACAIPDTWKAKASTPTRVVLKAWSRWKMEHDTHSGYDSYLPPELSHAIEVLQTYMDEEEYSDLPF